MDSSLRPIYATAEATKILAYPENPRKIRSLDTALSTKVRSVLRDRGTSLESPLIEFVSGKRRYVCRVFPLQSHSRSSFSRTVALVMERNPRGVVDLSRMTERFHLTRRERQVVEYLIQGLTSKEIANRMKISPNTVKVFLRMVMVKMGVSTRSGVIGKILQAEP